MENHMNGLESLAENHHDEDEPKCGRGRLSFPNGLGDPSLDIVHPDDGKGADLGRLLRCFRWLCLVHPKSGKSFAATVRKSLLVLYFTLFFLHAFLYILELVLISVSAAVTRDASVDSLRNLIYNTRYSFMVIKSLLLFLYFRRRSDSIVQLTAALEERSTGLLQARLLLKKVRCLTIIVVSLTLAITLAWEILDWASWGTGFQLQTWQQEVDIAVFGRKVKVWILSIFWYILGTPMTCAMNLAMVFFAQLVLTLYLNWRDMNQRLRKDPLYLSTHFSNDWEQLRRVAEEADDAFSAMVFVSWASDIVLSVGYLGSVIIYGAGNGREQAYTLLGLIIHAIWCPAIYLVPCILFDEQMMRTRQIVVGSVHQQVQNTGLIPVSNETKTSSLLLLNITLQNVAYRPVAFTAWKFFYITRNVILTIATVLVSYALVLIQLVGRKQEGTIITLDTAALLNSSSNQ